MFNQIFCIEYKMRALAAVTKNIFTVLQLVIEMSSAFCRSNVKRDSPITIRVMTPFLRTLNLSTIFSIFTEFLRGFGLFLCNTRKIRVDVGTWARKTRKSMQRDM
jgi:hypothetical protein